MAGGGNFFLPFALFKHSSKKYINLSIDTKSIPDFYLKGLHKLTIITDKKKTSSTLIRIGEAETPNSSLSPEIEKIEVLK